MFNSVLLIICVLLSVFLGFIVGLFIASKIKIRSDKELGKAITDYLQIENEMAKALGKESIINYVIDQKGMEYAIGYFGQTYMILHRLKEKRPNIDSIENSIKTFLETALSPELDQYKKMHMKEEKKDDKEKVEEMRNRILGQAKRNKKSFH